MDIEIELKLLATPSAQQDILAWLEQSPLNYSVFPGKQLRNDYFETEQRTLRKHDIGLRIRGHNGEFEQTVKTKGRVIAGMHQRPEYNVPLKSPDLNLGLFSPEIWPQSIDVTELERELYLMFSTDFLRHTYLITMNSSTQIELVFDVGEITANGRRLDICEIELELKKGDPKELFTLAMQLVGATPLRFGLQSKAARGYQLADNRSDKHDEPPAYFRVFPDKPLVENAVSALEQALSVWQQGEAAFYQSQNLDDWRTMRAGMYLVSEILTLYQTVFNAWETAKPDQKHVTSRYFVLKEELNHLLAQHQETETVLATMHMQANHYLERNEVPHYDVVSLQLNEFIERRKLTTMLNDLLANPESMRVQLAIGALCLDMTKDKGERSTSEKTTEAELAAQMPLTQFIADIWQRVENDLPETRTTFAACKVLWGGMNIERAVESDSDPWTVLRGEDSFDMSNALLNLLETNALRLELNVENAVMAWCSNN